MFSGKISTSTKGLRQLIKDLALSTFFQLSPVL